MGAPPLPPLPPEEKVGLTIYLLRPDKAQTFQETTVDPHPDPILLTPPLDGVFLRMEPEVNEPPWVRAVESLLQDEITAEMSATAPAGLLVVWRDAGTFLVTFGRAWQVVNNEWTEDDFGRKVALNAVPRDAVVWIKAEQLLAKGHLASERAPRAAPVDEFSVNFERDMLGAVEGVPTRNPLLGDKVRGGKNLHLTVPLGSFAAVLDECATLYASDAYKRDWPDIDNIQRVRDEQTITRLDATLDAGMAGADAADRITMYTPLQRNGQALWAESYVYGRISPRAVRVPYLTFANFSAYLARHELQPSVGQARATTVHVLDQYGQESGANVSALQCMGFEAALDGRPYILSSGTWYAVDAQFIASVNTAVQEIPQPPLALPAWNGHDDETAYNAACARDPAFLQCHERIVHYGGGQGQFEFCDLVHPESHTLCFVKKGSKSSGMSHLYEQVRRTVELVFDPDPGFRQRLIALFAQYHPAVDTTWLGQRQRPGDWTLCMISLGEPALTLPFFARCGLKTLYRELVKQGHAVAFAAV